MTQQDDARDAERWRFIKGLARLDDKCGCPPGPNWWIPVLPDYGFNSFEEAVDTFVKATKELAS